MHATESLLGISIICHRPYLQLLAGCLRSVRAALDGVADVPVAVCVSGVRRDHPILRAAERDPSCGAWRLEHDPAPLTCGEARNRTIAALPAKWIAFLDVDVTIDVHFARRALAAVAAVQDPECAALCAAFEPWDATSWGYLEYLNDVGCLLGKSPACRTPIWGCWSREWAERVRRAFPRVVPLAEVLPGPLPLESLQGCGQVIRRDFLTSGAFVDFYEDREMADVLRRAGKRIRFQPELVVRHRYRLRPREVLRRKWWHGYWHSRIVRRRRPQEGRRTAWGAGAYLRHLWEALLRPPAPFVHLPAGRLYYFLSTLALNGGCLAGYLAERFRP